MHVTINKLITTITELPLFQYVFITAHVAIVLFTIFSAKRAKSFSRINMIVDSSLVYVHG